jgi:hypothetical protein
LQIVIALTIGRVIGNPLFAGIVQILAGIRMPANSNITFIEVLNVQPQGGAL